MKLAQKLKWRRKGLIVVALLIIILLFSYLAYSDLLSPRTGRMYKCILAPQGKISCENHVFTNNQAKFKLSNYGDKEVNIYSLKIFNYINQNQILCGAILPEVWLGNNEGRIITLNNCILGKLGDYNGFITEIGYYYTNVSDLQEEWGEVVTSIESDLSFIFSEKYDVKEIKWE